MAKIYLLYYDYDHGDRENWNVFYTPVEAYSTKELRDARIEEVKKAPDYGDTLSYHEVDREIDAPESNAADYLDPEAEDEEWDHNDPKSRDPVPIPISHDLRQIFGHLHPEWNQ